MTDEELIKEIRSVWGPGGGTKGPLDIEMSPLRGCTKTARAVLIVELASRLESEIESLRL